MPWCHTCRIEYPSSAPACAECGGALTERPAPERRAADDGEPLRVIVTLPAEQALVASGRLDARGIPATLRRTAASDLAPFHVLVAEEHADVARAVLARPAGLDDPLRERVERVRGRDPAHTRALLVILVVTGIAIALAAMMVAARWFFSGSPLPR